MCVREKERERESFRVTAPTGGGCPAAEGQMHLTGYEYLDGCAKGEGGVWVNPPTQGAGSAVTAGEVPQHKVVSGCHSDTRKRARIPPYWFRLSVRKASKFTSKFT